MFRSLYSFFVVMTLLFNGLLFANNQIHILATVPAHAETKMKILDVDSNSLRQSIYLKTNYRGLTIATSDSSYGSSTLMNYRPIGVTPINFSDDIYTKSTKVGELIISQKDNRGSLGITISVK
jgi:hypothetical protein